MTRRQAKIEALRHIVAIADVTFDDEFYSGATDFSEKEAQKIKKRTRLHIGQITGSAAKNEQYKLRYCRIFHFQISTKLFSRLPVESASLKISGVVNKK